MAGRSPVRFLAPLALVAFAVALYAVVTNGGDERTAQPGSAVREGNGETGKKPVASKKKKRTRRSYTVRAGDTPSGIAEKTGVPLDVLLDLNPELDPQSLAPGTRIRLRR